MVWRSGSHAAPSKCELRRVQVVVRAVLTGGMTNCGSLIRDGAACGWSLNSPSRALQQSCISRITLLVIRLLSWATSSVTVHDTKDFAEFLATEMVDNELDGAVSRSTLRRRSHTTAATSSEAANTSTLHPLVPVGNYASGMPAQLHCVMCGKKTKTVCNGDGCRGMAICKTSKRSCYEDHCLGEGPSPKKGKTPPSREIKLGRVAHGLSKK